MNDDQPFLTDDELALHDEVKHLRQEHADLDAAIEALGHMPIPDQLRIARLKRKKLQLRDEIVKIESQILPDIIA
ncbi:YdcH family protein [Brevundimonas goettingensis]|uniref:DUF465 domain-containing protein n=1 Tax=Brevundimonas goettingensis TaxID=2774190 RepID=A0A975C2D4_9CAUL|nr:DUF465 domain-containing protein [Brevundimonas goettingensis]QTC91784.1 DUF465 domain-containing protein [Brevundimonas goettingensis]